MSGWKLAPPQAPGERMALTKAGRVAPANPAKAMPRYDKAHPGHPSNLVQYQTGVMPSRVRVHREPRPVRIPPPVACEEAPRGTALKAIREAAGFEAALAAVALGVDVGTIARWERGNPPRAVSGFIDGMARLYGVDRGRILSACKRTVTAWP